MNPNEEETDLLAPNILHLSSHPTASKDVEIINLKRVCADIIIEFLEVAFHQILFICDCYPPAVFMNRSKYGTPVKIVGHPGLRDYILKSLKALHQLIEQNLVSEVALLTTNGNVALAKFAFEINLLKKSISPDFSFVELEQSFRSLLIQISSYPIPTHLKATSFEIRISCNASCEMDLNNPDQSDLFWAKTVNDKCNKSKILPIQTINDPLVQMQFIVEDYVLS